MPETDTVDEAQLSECFRMNLALLMKEQGLNATSLSRKAGLNLRAVKDILDGRAKGPRLSTSYKLACALNVSLTSLLAPMAGPGSNSDMAETLDPNRAEVAQFLDTLSQAQKERLLECIHLLAAICAQE